MIDKIKIETKPVTGKVDDSFIGVKIKNDTVNIYYPESYNLTDKDVDFKGFRDDFLSIIRTISIAKTLASDKAKIESSLSHNGFALNSYLWIIKDYLTNGFYVNREKVFKSNQRGRINWKRTLNNQPIISNGNIIYNDVVVEVRNELDNLLVEIHKYCVKKSIDFIGWLFGLNSKHIQKMPFNGGIKKRYLIAIKQELDKTFDDYKKLRLNHMLKVIQGLEGDANDNEFVYGVDSYYYIFERMIDAIFSNRDASEFNPSAKWHLKNKKEFDSSKLRPDTILVKDKIAYILDAKYYHYGTTAKKDDLPETTSIQKQITYGDFVKQNKLGEDIRAIRNAFILPYNKYNNELELSNTLEYIGYAKTDYRKGEESHEIVHAFLIDLKHVIDTWNKDNHIDEITQLVNEIEEEQKEYKQTVKINPTLSDDFRIEEGQTYSVNILDSFYVSILNPKLKQSLVDKEITFVDGMFVINDKKYIELKGNKKYLTDYALRHLNECCLIFDNDQKIDGSNFKLSFCQGCENRRNVSENWLNDKNEHNKAIFKKAQDEDIERVLEDNREALDLKDRLTGSFAKMLDTLMTDNGFSNIQLYRESKVNDHKIADFLNGKKMPSLQDAMALCAAFELHPLVAVHFLNAGRHYIQNPVDDQMAFYNFLVNQCPGEGLNEWNVKINKTNHLDWVLP